jgi:hypothetical protein
LHYDRSGVICLTIMKSITHHIDDLDRMIDGNAPKHEIRSQVAFIGREVELLETSIAELTYFV